MTWPRAWGRGSILDFLCQVIVTDFLDMVVFVFVCVCVCVHVYACMRMCAHVDACV